ncbi:MAG: hypothetical protein JW966_04560, partial [Anaerolineae bacterium]|nr:hypothetical protein [Anaerolineae bacterium]
MKSYRARLLLTIAAAVLLQLSGVQSQIVLAQSDPGAICVSTFADVNGNGMQEESETVLPGVNVNLATAGAIIATHIIAVDETQYCFENLLPGIYTLTFTDSPTYRTTTANQGTFALASGQSLTINSFGAVPVPLENLRAEVAAQVAADDEGDQPLETSTRLLLSTVASMMVMIFMIGMGAVILGISGSRRRR